MPSKNTTLDLHKTLAHEIKSAKKAMFKRHREGIPLREAAEKFFADISKRFGQVIAHTHGDDAFVSSEREVSGIENETSVADLAAAISTIITSPITPARLRQEVADFKTDITNPTDSPEEIENALQAGQCGYACCPGSGDPLNPCPGPDGSGAHVFCRAERDADKPDDDDHVTVTLPNGKEVDLYGDAVDIAKEAPDSEASNDNDHDERLDVGQLVDIAMDGDRDQETRGAALFTLLAELETLVEGDSIPIASATVWDAKREAFKYLGSESQDAQFQLLRSEFLADGDFVR